MSNVISSRRSLLSGLGLGATATLFPSLRTRSARAAAPGVPKRIVFFWTGNGSLRPLALPVAPAGMNAPTLDSWALPDLLSPLKPYKEKMVMIENLDMISAELDPMDASNAHEWGNVHSLAATNMATGSSAGGISIDQYIANGLKAKGVVTQVPSIGMAWSVNKPCYSGRGQQIPMPASAKDWYKRLFPNGVPKPSPGTTPPTDPALAKSAAQQKSVLDAVNAELKTLAARMSSDDKAKLEAHAQAVSDLTKRLATLSGAGPGGASGAACRPLEKSYVDGLQNADGGSSGTQYSSNIDAQLRTIQAAFSCDLTRVATIVMDTPPGDQFGYNNGSWGTSDSHDLLHKTSDLNAADRTASLASNPDAAACIKRLYQRHYADLAKLAGYLDAIPEAGGTTLLDHTLIVYCSQIASGGHDLRRLPWFIVGGGEGMLKSNRYLRLPRRSPGIQGHPDQGVPHNNLFVSLANMLDVPTTTFGNPQACTGRLEGL